METVTLMDRIDLERICRTIVWYGLNPIICCHRDKFLTATSKLRVNIPEFGVSITVHRVTLTKSIVHLFRKENTGWDVISCVTVTEATWLIVITKRDGVSVNQDGMVSLNCQLPPVTFHLFFQYTVMHNI